MSPSRASSPPLAAPGAKRPWLWEAGVFVLFLAVYFLTQDKTCRFDGALMGGMLESSLTQIPRTVAFEWNHFLWYPTGRTFYLFLKLLHIPARGYEAAQIFNNIFGAAGITLLFVILRRMTSRAWALPFALLAGFSPVYWIKAISGECYTFAVFWAIVFAWFLLAYRENPTFRNVLGMSVATALTSYYHIGNAVLWALVGVAILIQRRRWLAQSLLMLAVFLLSVLIYAWVHRFFEPGGFQRWWQWGSTLTQGLSPFKGGAGGFALGVLAAAGKTGQTIIRSLVWWDNFGWKAVAAFAALGALGGGAVFWGRFRPACPPVPSRWKALDLFLFSLPALFLIGLYSVWLPGDYTYWYMHPPFIFLSLGVLAWRRQPERMPAPQAGAFALLVLLFAAHNFHSPIRALTKDINKRYREISLGMAAVTLPPSPIVISGRGAWSNLKPYIPYFANRNRMAVDLYFLNGYSQGRDPIAWMKEDIRQYMRQGVPVYLFEEVFQSTGDFGAYNLTPEMVESVWKDYRLLPVKVFDGPPPNTLYLLWDPGLHPEVQELITLRLKVAGLPEQALLTCRERARGGMTVSLRREMADLEALIPRPG